MISSWLAHHSEKVHIRNALNSIVEVKETDDPTLITGVQIVFDNLGGWFKLYQAAHDEEILATFDMTDSGVVDTRPRNSPSPR